jgi:hypothetical protein
MPRLIEGAIVVVLSALGALLLMGSVSLAPRDRIYGEPSDPLGEVWRLAQFDSGAIALVHDNVSDEANFPSGVPLRRAADASQILYDLPASLLARALGPVTGYSILVFLAFWTTALAAYFASRYLGIGMIGSGLTAVLFTLSPAHMIETQLHVGLAFVFMLPVLLALGVGVIGHPSGRRGALFGVALGLCGYLAAYLLLEASALALGLAAAVVIVGVVRPKARPALARAAAWSLVAASVVLAPLALVLVTHREEIASGLDRPISDVATFSLPLHAYLDPRSSPIGTVGLGLAIGGLIGGKLSRGTRLTLALVGLTGLCISLRPELPVLGVHIPMASKLIHSLIPYWRVFGRVAIVVALAASMLAGALVDRLATSSSFLVRIAAIALVVFAIADIVERPPNPAADLGRADRLSNVLQFGSGAVAEYPLFGFDNYALGPYLLRQLRHERPLFNGSIEGTLASDLAWTARTADAPEAREALSLAGVRTVVVHPGASVPNSAGFRPYARLPDGTSVYALTRAKNPVIASVRGAYPEEAGPDGTPFQWLAPEAELRVIADEGGPVTVTFDSVSPGHSRVAQFGTIARVISTAPTAVNLCVRGIDGRTATLPVSTVPPPRRLPGGDSRVAGIGIYHLRAEPGCR